MERVLSLIKNEQKETEKRIFPRFPFTYLTFKGPEGSTGNHVFEVRDISYTGMQLILKDGGHEYKLDQQIEGELHWKGLSLEILGKVKWINGSNLGVGFPKDSDFQDKIHRFFSVDNIVSSMKAIHATDMELDIPASLRYWIRGDGQVEIFVWQHNDNEFKKFEVIFLRQFVEWEDGKGIRTGKIIVNRDVDTPLMPEDEFIFEIDSDLDKEKVDFAVQLIKAMPQHLLPAETQEFLSFKLGV